MAQWHKRVTVNATVVSSIPTRVIELLFINIFISLVTRQSAALNSATLPKGQIQHEAEKKIDQYFFVQPYFNLYLQLYSKLSMQMRLTKLSLDPQRSRPFSVLN